MSLRPGLGGKSDLYTWREIFRLYTEVEVFESVSQSTRGERSIEGVEERLKLFEKLIQEEKASLTLPGSREGLDLFLSLTVFILNVKKVTGVPRHLTRFTAPTHELKYSSNSRIRKRLARSSRSTLNVRRFRFPLIFWEMRPHPCLPHVELRRSLVLRHLCRGFSCKQSARFFYPSYPTSTITRASSVPLSHSNRSGSTAAISSASGDYLSPPIFSLKRT